MADIRSPRVLYLKGALFLALGLLASTILLLENPSLRTAALLAIAVWSFARAHCFAFYVGACMSPPKTGSASLKLSGNPRIRVNSMIIGYRYGHGFDT